MKNRYIPIALLGAVVSGDLCAETLLSDSVHKSENRTFYSIIEKSSSTGEGIDKEVFQQTSESITNKKRGVTHYDITPQNVSPLAPKQNQWLNNGKGHGDYYDDYVNDRFIQHPSTQYKQITRPENREAASIRDQIARAASDINSTPYYKKAHQTEDAALKNQLSAMSKTIKVEEKKIVNELDSMSQALTVTSKKINNTGVADESSVMNQLAVSSRLAGHKYETPDEYMAKQLSASSKAMQRSNTFYPDSLGASDMKKLILTSESLDNGKKRSLNDVLNEIFTRKPKSQVTPIKPKRVPSKL